MLAQGSIGLNFQGKHEERAEGWRKWRSPRRGSWGWDSPSLRFVLWLCAPGSSVRNKDRTAYCSTVMRITDHIRAALRVALSSKSEFELAPSRSLHSHDSVSCAVLGMDWGTQICEASLLSQRNHYWVGKNHLTGHLLHILGSALGAAGTQWTRKTGPFSSWTSCSDVFILYPLTQWQLTLAISTTTPSNAGSMLQVCIHQTWSKNGRKACLTKGCKFTLKK